MQLAAVNSKKNNYFNLTVIYTLVVLLVSQSEYSRFLFFLIIPLFIFLIFKHSKLNIVVIKYISPIILIIIISFISGLLNFENTLNYFFFRDILYFIQSVFFIIFGTLLLKQLKDFRMVLQLIVLSSTIISLVKLSSLLTNPQLLFTLNIDFSDASQLSNSTAIISFMLLYLIKIYKLKIFSNRVQNIFILISLISISVSLSRTTYLILFIILLIPFIKSIFYNKIYFISLALILFTIFGGLFFNLETKDIKTQRDFFEKIENSFDEIFVKNYTNKLAIYSNWRGYEAYMGLEKYYEGNVIQLLCGQGFGSFVKTPDWVFSEKNQLDIIPMFHNGFITILLKSGIVGFILYFIFLYRLLKTSTYNSYLEISTEVFFIKKMLFSTVLIILFFTFVIHGIFRTVAPLSLLMLVGISIEYLINYREKASYE